MKRHIVLLGLLVGCSEDKKGYNSLDVDELQLGLIVRAGYVVHYAGTLEQIAFENASICPKEKPDEDLPRWPSPALRTVLSKELQVVQVEVSCLYEYPKSPSSYATVLTSELYKIEVSDRLTDREFFRWYDTETFSNGLAWQSGQRDNPAALFELKIRRPAPGGAIEVSATILPGSTKKREGAWQELAPEGEGFSILMPGEAKVSSKAVPQFSKGISQPEKLFHITEWTVSYDSKTFCISVDDDPIMLNPELNPLKNLDGISADMSLQGILISEKKLSLSSHVGRARELKLTDGRISLQRQYATAEKRFILEVHLRPEEKNSPQVEAFLDSFRFLP